MNISINPQLVGLLNPKVRRQSFGISSLLMLLVVGAAFTAIGLGATRLNKIDPAWIKVSGQIVDSKSNVSSGSSTYAPVVQYQVNGQKYRVVSRTSSSSYPNIG